MIHTIECCCEFPLQVKISHHHSKPWENKLMLYFLLHFFKLEFFQITTINLPSSPSLVVSYIKLVSRVKSWPWLAKPLPCGVQNAEFKHNSLWRTVCEWMTTWHNILGLMSQRSGQGSGSILLEDAFSRLNGRHTGLNPEPFRDNQTTLTAGRSCSTRLHRERNRLYSDCVVVCSPRPRALWIL